ncbi:MAG: arsenosugar biosynthesis radical SAM (seleno)protein ArsS [Thermoplasmatota archaeon]
MSDFGNRVREVTGSPLRTGEIHTFQVNIGLKCNQQCSHCHHQAGPEREGMMTWETMEMIIDKAGKAGIPIIDITGGAPEMNPNLRRFVTELGKKGHHIMLRTNLTALMEEGNAGMAEFYRDSGLELIASLPCYESEEVDCVRGDGVFEKSIEALMMLNDLGYGRDPNLKLNLVYNPMADFLPPPQDALREEYRYILGKNHSIDFTDLFTITNMPMGRFLQDLRKDGKEKAYMELLKKSFNPSTVLNLMCRFQINIGWDGSFYDCDFNQAMGIGTRKGFPGHIGEMDPSKIPVREVVTGEHCFGCTAGAGSSCGGALTE